MIYELPKNVLSQIVGNLLSPTDVVFNAQTLCNIGMTSKRMKYLVDEIIYKIDPIKHPINHETLHTLSKRDLQNICKQNDIFYSFEFKKETLRREISTNMHRTKYLGISGRFINKVRVRKFQTWTFSF